MRNIFKMIIVILISAVTRAYIPAIAVNITIGTRTTPFKEVHLARPSSFFTAEVFQQVVADSAPNALYQKGIIMHFTEEQSDEPPSAVPWIALISCDSNGTTYSLTEEIFGIVSSKGAQAALMWSNYSTTCLLNQEVLYLNGYPRPLAVYTTGELAISKLIEAQILQLPTAAYTYSSKVLNDSINLAYRLLEGSNLKIPNEDPSSLTWTSPVATITSTATSLLGCVLGASNVSVGSDHGNTYTGSVSVLNLTNPTGPGTGVGGATVSQTGTSRSSATIVKNSLGNAVVLGGLSLGIAVLSSFSLLSRLWT